MRQIWVWLHRWAGLAMTAFLVIIGLTGTLLAFNTELEHVFAPQLFASPRPGVAALDLATLAARAAALVPRARVRAVSLIEPDQATVDFIARTDPATGKPYDLGFTEFHVDPWTGMELGRRRAGDLSQGSINVMPFIYELHWTLALGAVGQWTLGIVALIWTLDCFVGFYLTLPVAIARFWPRWQPAWLIKRGASTLRLNMDLHRAHGLWLWPLLFIFAWSSVMMNIRPVYEWVTTALFDYRSPVAAFMSIPQRSVDSPRLGWRAAQTWGAQLVAAQAAQHGYKVGQALGLAYWPSLGAYSYDVRSNRDIFQRSPKGGSTSVMFDGDTGALIQVSQPTGEHSGNTIESWLYALHMARIFGMPYRILVAALGLATALLSITGVYIWLRKRRARHWSRERQGRSTGIDQTRLP